MPKLIQVLNKIYLLVWLRAILFKNLGYKIIFPVFLLNDQQLKNSYESKNIKWTH